MNRITEAILNRLSCSLRSSLSCASSASSAVLIELRLVLVCDKAGDELRYCCVRA